ncbi:alpha/beta fold hydrolase [Pseudotabrizicola sp.]|uniref:alpha/beta fold hydrolase n=1 Tax=Pseudotabrizicola sp. TaxID=2939647 RepID=UPI002722B91E|nr:alpha/beta fold hydrolase [Pseudotabrizicola sp.]MDO8883674.1 alpha/beta fold hydrolase [Pseudotabrizicola sp.]
MTRWSNLVIGVLALGIIALSAFMLERGRAGLVITDLAAGKTPATLYHQPESAGPLVVVAHGFAGSRQLMQAYSLTLAQSGYAVLAFDFEGHGRNPVPMSGDVNAIEGTTQRLVDQTLNVLAAGRDLPGVGQGVALLGHSMATDIIARAAIADGAVNAVVGISMFSQAVTADQPARLLVISGQWEAMLRAAALQMARMVDPAAVEGATITAGDVTRRVVVAPGVEHVGVLYSGSGLREARDWLDATFERESAGPVVKPGLWILLLLAGVAVLFRPLAGLLPVAPARPVVPVRRFWAAVLLPAAVVPLVAVLIYRPFLPVLVADYLILHLALYGAAQLAILRVWPLPRVVWAAALALMLWGVAVFGFAIDRYAASFVPTAQRMGIIAALGVGTVPFMLADSVVAVGGWRRLVARLAFVSSLTAATFIDLERLLFVLIILPVIVLFFLVLGPMGHWVTRQSGAGAAGLGLGIILAWALGVSFPLFVAG